MSLPRPRLSVRNNGGMKAFQATVYQRSHAACKDLFLRGTDGKGFVKGKLLRFGVFRVGIISNLYNGGMVGIDVLFDADALRRALFVEHEGSYANYDLNRLGLCGLRGFAGRRRRRRARGRRARERPRLGGPRNRASHGGIASLLSTMHVRICYNSEVGVVQVKFTSPRRARQFTMFD